MKKKIMIGAVAALFLGAGIFIATNLKDREPVSDLTLANIEAMTNLGDKDWEYENGQPQRSQRCGNRGCSTMIQMCEGGGSGCNQRLCSNHDK